MKLTIACLCICLFAFGCRSAETSGASSTSGVEVPPRLLDRSQKGLAIQVLTSPEVARSGWSIVAIEDESIRVRQSSYTHVTTVDIFFENGHFIPHVVGGTVPSDDEQRRLSHVERQRLAELQSRMERALSALDSLHASVRG